MKYLIALFAMMLMLGCVKPPVEGRMDPYAPSQVQFGGTNAEDLRLHTAVGIPKASRDEAGLLHVTVPIRAATDLQLYIDYRVTFLDANGAVVSQTGWFTKTLPPNVFDQISVTSMSPRAADFQVDVRYAQ